MNGRVFSPTASWNNGRLWNLPLEPLDRPEAVDDFVTTLKNTPTTVDVLANDSDPWNQGLTISAVGTPPHGSTAISGTVVVYTPTLNYTGGDSFTYTVTYTPTLNYNSDDHFAYVVSDGSLFDVATVSVTVTPVNDLPIISDIPDQSTPAGTPTDPITFTVRDVETPAVDLVLSADRSATKGDGGRGGWSAPTAPISSLVVPQRGVRDCFVNNCRALSGGFQELGS